MCRVFWGFFLETIAILLMSFSRNYYLEQLAYMCLIYMTEQGFMGVGGLFFC